MARPKKKKIELNTDSFLSMAQEAYNELVEQRSTAIRQINENKKKVDIEDTHDLGTMNKVNTDLLKLVDSTIDKKLNILKMMSSLIFKGDSNSEVAANGSITPEDMEMIETLMGKGKTNGDDNDEYKLK
jgi:hypothetical protein